MMFGWDLSNHDWERRYVDLAEARRAGITWVTHKASEGTAYRDPYLGSFGGQVRQVGFGVAGSYHVLNGRVDPVAQTDHWGEYVTDAVPWWRKHLCWIWQIDAEPLDGYREPTKAEILACAERLQHEWEVPRARIVVYAPKWCYEDDLAGLGYPLWASSYGPNDARDYRRAYLSNGPNWAEYSGQRPMILQYGSRTTIGKQPTCDANVIAVDTLTELQALFGAYPPDDLLEWIMSLPGAPKTLTYQQLLHDIARTNWTADVVPAQLDPHTGKPDPQNPTWTAANWLRWILKKIETR